MTLTLGVLAGLTGSPLLYPSLGATAFLVLASPAHPFSAPRAVLLSHTFGIASGYLALVAFGLSAGPRELGVELGLVHCVAMSTALAATAALMLHFEAIHPPAGATTLIVSLGLIHRPVQLLVMELGLVLLVAQSRVLPRLTGALVAGWTRRREP